MRSIKHKIWFSILGVTLVVIALIWFSQVVLLEKIYLANEEAILYSDSEDICKTIQEDGVNQAVLALTDLVSDNNYSVQIIDIKGENILSIQPEGSKNLFMDSDSIKLNIFKQLSNVDEGTIVKRTSSTPNGLSVYIMASMQQVDLKDYIIMIGATLAPVKEAVTTIQHQLIFITVFLILLASTISFFIARSLTKPITQLSEGVFEIARGNLDTQVNIKSKDELGKLGSDFNIMAKEISKASTLQRELIANVSHDIRTPLTMIQGYAEIIKDLTGDNKQKRDSQLDIIIEETNRLNVLVNDILDLSKLQSKQLTLNLQEFDLAQKTRDILKRYDLLILNENYHFDFISPQHLFVYADEIKIEQVLYNIINNATNHTGADKSITVVLEDHEDHAVVKIIDTGKGIEPEFIPLIWDRYYKPYKKNDRKGMGTGLGLSIVKAILQTHEFEFGVDSTINVGTTFWFEVKKK